MASISIGPFTVGEKPPPLVYGFRDADNVVIDLTDNYQAGFDVREHWAPMGPSLPATVTNPTNGEVTHQWAGTEFPTPGHYYAQFWTGNGTNRYASPYIEFDVQLPAGAVPII